LDDLSVHRLLFTHLRDDLYRLQLCFVNITKKIPENPHKIGENQGKLFKKGKIKSWQLKK
jgi:hypothetical protein